MAINRDWTMVQKKFPREFQKRYRALIRNRYSKTKVGKRLLSRLEEYVLRGGKRIRPYLVLVGTLGGKKVTSDAFWNYASGIELIHAGMLVHDDIIDDSESRRDKPSMHILEGKDRSLVVGDIAWSLGFQFLLNARVPNDPRRLGVEEFLRATVLVAEGQVLDLDMMTVPHLNKRELFSMYELKTASYTCVAPLVMGAYASGQKTLVPALRQIGYDLGLLFQLRDDMSDIDTDVNPHLHKIHLDAEAESKRLYSDFLQHVQKAKLPTPMKQSLLDIGSVVATHA